MTHQWLLWSGRHFYTGLMLSLERDFHLGSRRVKRNGATYIPRSLMQEKWELHFLSQIEMHYLI